MVLDRPWRQPSRYSSRRFARFHGANSQRSAGIADRVRFDALDEHGAINGSERDPLADFPCVTECGCENAAKRWIVIEAGNFRSPGGAGEFVPLLHPTGKLMLNVLGSVAEFERTMMLERQREGIAKAKSEGKYIGRKPTALAKAGEVKELAAKGVRAIDIAKRLGICRASVYRALRTA